MATSDQAEETLADLPPSAKLVFKVLEVEGALTQTEVAEESMLSARTVRDAVGRLKAIDAIDEEVCMLDTRKSIYRINESTMRDGGDEGTCCAD